MTPFGIRKKIKALLGLGNKSTPSAPERPRYTVTFQLPNNEDYRVEAKEGDSLVLASGRGAYPIATGCSDGTCATCSWRRVGRRIADHIKYVFLSCFGSFYMYCFGGLFRWNYA